MYDLYNVVHANTLALGYKKLKRLIKRRKYELDDLASKRDEEKPLLEDGSCETAYAPCVPPLLPGGCLRKLDTIPPGVQQASSLLAVGSLFLAPDPPCFAAA